MCIRDRGESDDCHLLCWEQTLPQQKPLPQRIPRIDQQLIPVSYTHLRAHETVLDLVCRLLLEKKKQPTPNIRLSNLTLIIPLRRHLLIVLPDPMTR